MAARTCAGLRVELVHDGARGGNLPLRHPPIGLCKAPHDTEGDAEKLLADVLGCQRRRLAGDSSS
jgi:hypothetical protein